MKEIPTIRDINENIYNDLKNKLNLSTDFLKKTFNALSVVLSAQFHLVYLYLRDVQDNVFPDTASPESQGGTLERQGRIYLNRNPFPDSTGVFKVSVTGVVGSVLRTDLTFKSNDDALNQGQVYVLDSQYVLTGVDDEIEIRSLGVGTSFNLDLGDNLTITEPVIGVNKTVTVTEIVIEAQQGETLDLYRQAILTAIQLEPQGGSKSDYRQWATDAQGVRLIYPYVRDTDASVIDVYVEATREDSTDDEGTPSNTLLEKVEKVIEQDPDTSKQINERGRRPMQATVEVSPIVLVPVDVTITGLSDDSASVETSIRNALKDLLYEVRPFISGADLRRNKNDILYSGKVQAAVTDVLTNGNFFNVLQVFVDGNEITSYEFDLGNIPYLRNLTI